MIEHLPDEAVIPKETVAEYLHMPVKRLVQIATGHEITTFKPNKN